MKTREFVPGAVLIERERERQIEEEGYDSEHDSKFHRGGELADAAACYANLAAALIRGAGVEEIKSLILDGYDSILTWPFDHDEFKPVGEPIRNLVKAGALIAAEIDRLQSLQRGGKSMTTPLNEITRLQHAMEIDYEAGTLPNSYRAHREAVDNNLDVVYPKPNQLQLDIDSDDAFEIFSTLIPIIEKYYGVLRTKVSESRSGLPKRHVTIDLIADVTNFERIALQAALGSDRVREILSIVQESNHDPHPTLFLEKKIKTGV